MRGIARFTEVVQLQDSNELHKIATQGAGHCEKSLEQWATCCARRCLHITAVVRKHVQHGVA